MAIKGKKRCRGGTGVPRPVAPKPKLDSRKPPLAQRAWFRRTFAGASALLALFVILTVLGRTHRASALRNYDRALLAAERPFKASTDAADAKSVATAPTQFAAGTVKPKDLRLYAKGWETNFTASAAAVRKLEVPSQISAANEQIAGALDAYAGVARLYSVAADEKDLQIAATDKALATKIGAHIVQLLAQITETKNRADTLLSLAQAQIDDLKRHWGVAVTTPQVTQSLPAGLSS